MVVEIKVPPSSTQQLPAKQDSKNLSPVRGDPLYQPPKHHWVLSILWGKAGTGDVHLEGIEGDGTTGRWWRTVLWPVQCPALTSAAVQYQSPGMVTNLHQVKFRCHLHGVTRIQISPVWNHIERTATQRQESRLRGTSGDDTPSAVQVTSARLGKQGANTSQSTEDRQNRQDQKQLLTLRRSWGIKWPHLPHTLHPALCNETQGSNCQESHQRMVCEQHREG